MKMPHLNIQNDIKNQLENNQYFSMEKLKS